MLNWNDISRLKLKSGDPIHSLLGSYQHDKDTTMYVLLYKKKLGESYCNVLIVDQNGAISGAPVVVECK